MTIASAQASIAPATPPNPETASEGWPFPISLALYLKMAELELIRPEEHVVLLDGFLVQTMTKGHDHINAVDRGEDALKAVLPPGWLVRDEDPIVLAEGPEGASVPEPDLVVLYGTRERYDGRLPGATDVALVVEVASSAAAFLADRKGLARYAYAGIPAVWIITLHDRRAYVYTEPSGPAAAPGYARVEEKGHGDMLAATLSSPACDQAPVVLGPVAVASFFPPTA